MNGTSLTAHAYDHCSSEDLDEGIGGEDLCEVAMPEKDHSKLKRWGGGSTIRCMGLFRNRNHKVKRRNSEDIQSRLWLEIDHCN